MLYFKILITSNCKVDHTNIFIIQYRVEK